MVLYRNAGFGSHRTAHNREPGIVLRTYRAERETDRIPLQFLQPPPRTCACRGAVPECPR